MEQHSSYIILENYIPENGEKVDLEITVPKPYLKYMKEIVINYCFVHNLRPYYYHDIDLYLLRTVDMNPDVPSEYLVKIIIHLHSFVHATIHSSLSKYFKIDIKRDPAECETQLAQSFLNWDRIKQQLPLSEIQVPRYIRLYGNKLQFYKNTIDDFKYRKWQTNYIQFYIEHTKGLNWQLLSAPTGAGKTAVYLTIADMAVIDKIYIHAPKFIHGQIRQQAKIMGIDFEQKIVFDNSRYIYDTTNCFHIIDDEEYNGFQSTPYRSNILFVSTTRYRSSFSYEYLQEVDQFFERQKIVDTAIENQTKKLPLQYYNVGAIKVDLEKDVFNEDKIIKFIQGATIQDRNFYMSQLKGCFNIDVEKIIKKYFSPEFSNTILQPWKFEPKLYEKPTCPICMGLIKFQREDKGDEENTDSDSYYSDSYYSDSYYSESSEEYVGDEEIPDESEEKSEAKAEEERSEAKAEEEKSEVQDEDYIQGDEVVILSCSHILCKECIQQIQRGDDKKFPRCPICRRDITSCYTYSLTNKKAIQQDVQTFFEFQRFVTKKEYQDLFEVKQKVKEMNSIEDIVRSINKLKGQKVFINFENGAKNYCDNIVLDHKKIKRMGGRVNWDFKTDITIPLHIFDRMEGINMNNFNHVVLLCRNVIQWGDKQIQHMNRFCRSERKDLMYHMILIKQ